VLFRSAIGAGAVMAFTGGEATIDEAELFTVQRMDFKVTSTASGELKAKQQTEIRSEVEGRSTITEIVDEGSFVEEGDVLVRLSDDEIKKNLDNELLNYESAKSALISAETSLEIQKSDNDSALRKALLEVELAQLAFDKWLNGDVKEKENEIALSIDRGERELERVAKKLKRSENLFKEDFLSEDQMDLDRIAYIEAVSKLKTAKLQRDVYETYTYVKESKELNSKLDESKAELDRVKSKNASQIANKDADLSKARQQAAIRKTQVEKLQETLKKTVITAPTAGLVVYATSVQPSWRWDNRGPLVVGREVRHNEDLIVLPDTAVMMSAIKVHETLVSKIVKGQIATVTIDAVPGKTFPGVVDSIGIVAVSGGWRDANNREYDVKIALSIDGNAYDLKPSMRCEAQIVMKEVTDAIAVPVHAVFTEGSAQYVYLAEGNRFRKRIVEVGDRSDTFVAIIDGLAENDRVLLREPSPALVINPDEGKESEADREKAGPTIEPVSIAKDAVSATDAVPVAATE